MEEQIQPARSEVTNLSIRDIFFKYLRFLPLFIISIALCLFVAYIYLRYATPVYSATGSMVIRDEKSSRGSSNDKFEEMVMSDGTKNIQNEIEVLRSRPMMIRVVRALNLNFTYKAKGNIKEMNVYNASPFRVEVFELADSTTKFNLNVKFKNANSFYINDDEKLISFGQVFKNKFGVFRLIHTKPGPINDEYNVLYQPEAVVAKELVSDLVVAPKANTGILVLTLEATNPQLAADVINQLMREYQLATVEDKNVMLEQTLHFIDDRLREVSRGLDSITNQKLAYQRASDLVDFEAQSTSYFTRIDETDKELNEQRVRLNMAQMINSYLRDQRNEFTPVPSSLGLEDATLNALVPAYNVAQMERKQLLDDNVPRNNLLVRQKEEQIEEYRKKILENLKNIISSYNASIRDIASRSSSMEAQIRSLPVKQQNLIEIERQQQSKLAVYNYLMEKREESAISRASNISNTKQLEQATLNLEPVKPNRWNAQMLAIIIGIVIPALFIFVLELMDDKVNTRHDIERITNATILGEVGHSYNQETLVVTTNNRSVVAEQFRILRSNLQYILNNTKKPVIMVTSSFSGEGKSFVSTNVGAVIALTGKRTIILEFDIRKPKIISQLHIPKKPGLTNYLLGKISLEDLPIPVPGHDHLFVLPCGPVPPNPSELLLDPRLKDLFDYLKETFDVVIVDTAPVGMVSDAMTLGSFSDCTLYIVRQGHTYKKQIGLIDELYTQGKLPKISLVMNDVKIRTGYGYYGYGRYGYGKGYGAGYFEDEEPANPLIARWFGWLDAKKWKKKKKRKSSTV